MRVIDFFDKGVARDPERLLAVGGGTQLTFHEGAELSERIARGLYAAGFRLGDGVGVLAPNHPLALGAMLGLWRAGGAWVPLNTRNATATTAGYLQRARPRWLLFHSAYRSVADQLVDEVPSLVRAICLDDAEFDEFLAAGAGAEVPEWSDVAGAPDALAAFMPTGGTTGQPKAVPLRNSHWTAMQTIALTHWPQAPDPVNLMVAPITHAAGGTAVMLAGVGATTIMHEGFDPQATLEAIEEHRVTHLFLPPTAFYALIDEAEARPRDVSSLRMLLLAASPVAPEKLRRGVELFGPCVCQCYGQAEAPMLVTWLDPQTVASSAAGEHPERLASAGRATLPTLLRIMDDDGRLLAVGEIGEIVVRGGLVASEYLDDAEATAEGRAHGWHHTGDIGYLDADGFVYIVDRKKDMIITGGFNVYSAEVEAAILAVPGVRECAVIGIPDDRWGEMVFAVAVPDSRHAPTEDTVTRAVKAALGSVKAPKRVEFVEALPKTPVGKVDKKAIRGEHWGGKTRMVG